MKNKLILTGLIGIAVLCSCSAKRYKDTNDTVPPGTDSSMMIKNDSGMNRGNPKTDTDMNHGNAVMAGDTGAARKKTSGADTASVKKAVSGQDAAKNKKG